MRTEQIQLVKQSWAKVGQIQSIAGPLFYNRLFEIAPELKPLFKSGNVEEQSKKLFFMLNYIISKLDNLEPILNEVKALALRHVKYGVKEAHYQTVGAALLWTLEKGLKEDWTEEVKQAWITVYQLLSGAMISASKESVAIN